MNKILVLALAAVSAAVSFAEPSWAYVTSVEAENSSAASSYTAYLCTTATAGTYFDGNTSYADITAYLGKSDENYKNYNEGMKALATGAEILTAYGYDDGEYSFSKYYQPGTLSGDYIAVLAYDASDANMFRVFQGTAAGDRLILDPAAGQGAAGAWTAVPEPTSGLLLLMGFAGLALRRRRA